MEMTKKRLSAIRFDRDSRLMAELFTNACLPDTRTMVPQNRIDLLKKQATSLSTHQVVVLNSQQFNSSIHLEQIE
jgi:SWI/SNF-related matrix-associated actin-dependent regulator of chromatin subfamily E protein 1